MCVKEYVGCGFADVEDLRDFLCELHDEEQRKEQEALAHARQKFVRALEGRNRLATAVWTDKIERNGSRSLKKVKSKLEARMTPGAVEEEHTIPGRKTNLISSIYWGSVLYPQKPPKFIV